MKSVEDRLLDIAKEIELNPNHWTKGVAARTQYGTEIAFYSDLACADNKAPVCSAYQR